MKGWVSQFSKNSRPAEEENSAFIAILEKILPLRSRFSNYFALFFENFLKKPQVLQVAAVTGSDKGKWALEKSSIFFKKALKFLKSLPINN